MWNFTVRAIMLPNTDGLEHILCDKEACLSSQSSAIDMEPQEFFQKGIKRKRIFFSAAVDKQLSELLHAVLNKVDLRTGELKQIKELQLNSYLSNIENNIENPCKYKI